MLKSRLKTKLLISILFVAVIMSIILITSLNLTLSAAETSDFNQLNYVQLLDEMGTAWNAGNQLEAANNGIPGETNWGNPVITKEMFAMIKNAGFNTIRIPVSYLSKIGPAPDYTIDSAWLDRIQEVVDYAYSQDMFVLINMHGDGYHTVQGGWLLPDVDGQATIRDRFSKVWTQIATRFVNYDERLIFEGMNEVFDGDWDPPEPEHYVNFNAFNQTFVDSVRKTGGNNAARWLLVAGWNTNIDYTVKDFGFVMPTDSYRSSSIPSSEKRLAISVHYYSPWDFCGDTSSSVTQWGQEATNPDKVSTWGQEDFVEQQFYSMYDKFVTQGYPFIIGEYGAIDKTGADSTNAHFREVFMETVAKTIKKYGGVPVYWDNGYNGAGGFGLFDRSTLKVTQQGIINAIMDAENNTADFNPGVPPVLITPTPMPDGSFDVDYEISSGGTVNVIITNNLTTRHVEGWTMEFTFPGDQKIVNLWNGTFTQDGKNVVIKNADYNKRISANGGSVTFGFNTSFTGTNEKPGTCKINGSTCVIVPGATTPPTSTVTSTPTPIITSTPTPIITPTPVITQTPTPIIVTETVTPVITPTPIITTPIITTPVVTTPVATTPQTPSNNDYSVAYSIQSDWGAGAIISVTINNYSSTALNNWTLEWTFPGNQAISNLWNGKATQTGANVVVSNESYNGYIAANGNTSFGMNISYTGTNSVPASFTLNGVACSIE